MALYQDNGREIRYLKNTEREQKVIGNYYRDVIRQYGIDVNYYKLRLPHPEVFRTTVDENAVLRHAYGYDESPDYSISAQMVTYMEVQDDLLQLDRYGLVPNTTVSFWFDREDFACALAQRLGQLKEYKVRETEFAIEVPECLSDAMEYEFDGQRWTYSLSDDIFPYAIGYGVPETFETEILSGKFACTIGPYTIGPDGQSEETTVQCQVLEHGDVDISFPTNEWTASSFKRHLRNVDFVETMLLLTYRVSRVPVEDGKVKFILHGRLHGGVLFNDLHKVGKYMDLIHPDVGDVLTIGFPQQDGARQQYEITECTDRRMSNDGINPLLGKYVWLCKAKRRVDCGEGVPERNEDDLRVKEAVELTNAADEEVSKGLASYDEEESDAVYGGYERNGVGTHDRRAVSNADDARREFVDDGSCIDIFQFHDGCRLVTDGYELYYVTSDGSCAKLTAVEDRRTIPQNLVASGLQYIKATDDALWFVNFDNRACRICEAASATGGGVQMCLNSLTDTTVDGPSHNENGQCFYKFRESRTVLVSAGGHLYCRFGNQDGGVVRLA